MDIEAPFLRELLEEDADFSKKILDYDPYVSDLMSLSFISKGHKKRSGVLAYPMGQHFERLGKCFLLMPLSVWVNGAFD